VANSRADDRILLCCDLDRTVLPNGSAREDPEARPVFRQVTARSEILLVYASGRSERLLRHAIEKFEIPEPAYAVGDVGSTIFSIQEGTWHRLDAWYEQIADDWKGRSRNDLEAMIGQVVGLELQEPDKQGRFKLSYYADLTREREHYLQAVREPLGSSGIDASISWSIDEAEGTGLVDILPASATKHHAVAYLVDRLGVSHGRTVYAGDSGNDLPALTSGLQAVLVANARRQVREDALREAEDPSRLYLACGGFHGLNGNYASGVLEGLAHFIPDVDPWIGTALEAVRG
jgi:HAD superfamily hydrolase (TIGR01484 family)